MCIKKKILSIPKGVFVGIKRNVIFMKGSVGFVKKAKSGGLNVFLLENYLVIVTKLESKTLINTFKSLVLNMLDGVRTLFKKTLELKGLGFNLKKSDSRLVLKLGFSHPTVLSIPKSLIIDVLNKDGTLLSVQGSDNQLVGEFAGKVKSLYPVEPYKGRGVRILGQFIYKKEGKKLN